MIKNEIFVIDKDKINLPAGGLFSPWPVGRGEGRGGSVTNSNNLFKLGEISLEYYPE